MKLAPKILYVFGFLLLGSTVFSQVGLKTNTLKKDNSIASAETQKKYNFNLPIKLSFSESSSTNYKPSLKPFMTISKSNVYDCYGAICKFEVKMDKKTKVPMRFRLGSLNYVDYLEGK